MDGIENSQDKVWVTIDRTINLGNYESIKISAGLSQTIEPKTKRLRLLDATIDSVIEIVTEKANELQQQLQKKKPKFSPKERNINE